jgi:hypothetical protein
VIEVSDAEGLAALRFQASVDGFGGSRWRRSASMRPMSPVRTQIVGGDRVGSRLWPIQVADHSLIVAALTRRPQPANPTPTPTSPTPKPSEPSPNMPTKDPKSAVISHRALRRDRWQVAQVCHMWVCHDHLGYFQPDGATQADLQGHVRPPTPI